MDLIENNDLLQAVFDSAPNGIAVMKPLYDREGRVEDFSILLFNAYTLNWIGDIDYKGKRYSDVFPMVKETGILEKFIQVAETGEADNFERWYTGEGMKHWFHFNAVKQGGLMVVTTEDITDKKQTETAFSEALNVKEKQQRLYDSITNNTPDLVYVFGLDYCFTYANKALLSMWGKSAEEAIGKGLRENGYEEWHARMHEREIDEIVATKRSIRGTVSFPHAELGSRVYDYILVPVLNAAGEVEAIAGTTRDVTDLKQVEEKLQQSESRLKSMIGQTPAPTLVLMGDNLVIEQINHSMLRMIGHGEEVIGVPLLELMPELADQYIWKQVERVYKEGVNFDQWEVPVSHKRTGELKDYYYNIAYRPLKEHGEIVGMIQVAIDVTEQVASRKKLEESENRFRALVNASSDVIYSMSGDWSVMNPLDGRGFISDNDTPIKNWMEKNLYPSDHETVRKAIAAAIAKKSTFELEHRVLTADGSIGWTYSRAVPILDEQGNITEWFGTAGDITDRKMIEQSLMQSESRFRDLADESPMFVFIVEPDPLAPVSYWNKTWLDYTGQTFEEAQGRAWDGIIHPDDISIVMDHYVPALNNHQPYFIPAVRTKRHDGEYRWYAFKGNPRYMADGSFNGYVGVGFDVHEQKSTEERLEFLVNERTKELQRSNEDLQQFAHVASHDLKEPVRKIKTFTMRLEEQLKEKLDEPSERFIERIHVATDRMATMIDGVLAYSTTNAVIQKPELVDLNEVIKNIETDLEVALQKSLGVIHYHNLPALEGAPVLLYQLFYNLINNSIKFARAGIPPQITISSETAPDRGTGYIRITLRDNGIGFDTGQATRIFETFTRLNSKDKYEGTGLGLSLCKKIVERHGGTITANAVTDEGAEFIITLPLQQKETGI